MVNATALPARPFRPLAWGLLLAGAALLCFLAAPVAAADTAPLAPSASPSWLDPDHGSPLEVLAGEIASQIAARPVTVRCEAAANWSRLIRARGGDPNAESGYVLTTWNDTTGALMSASTSTELSGRDVCSRLADFATASSKPTKCATNDGLRTPQAVRGASLRKAKRAGSSMQPCYLGNGAVASPMTAAYWSDYEDYAVAILTLAHESVHLGGIVGGRLANGQVVGDAQAEAKADCYGMQSMAAVAVRLGDTPADAQAIATYFWDKIYARSKTSTHAAYWSANCRPGGTLDIRAAGHLSWP